METAKRYAVLLFKLAMGMFLLFVAHHYYEAESARPERNPWIVGGSAALGALGMLITPYCGDLFAGGFKRGADLVRYGRRASQGEVDVTAPDAPTPPTTPGA